MSSRSSHRRRLPPGQAVLAVELYRPAVVLEEFGQVIAAGGAGVHISSMAGHMPPPLDPERAHALAYTPTDELLALPISARDAVPNSGVAYTISKQANHLRVQAAAVTWGDRGELHQPRHHPHPRWPRRDGRPGCRGLPEDDRGLRRRPGRHGDELVTAAALLLGPDAGLITGTDLLMDGDVIAALRAGRWQPSM